MVAATVRARPGKVAPAPPEPVDERPLPKARPGPPPVAAAPPAPRPKRSAPKPPPDPERIEPGRKRRIAREREPIGGRLDLHGMTQDQARAVLHGFIERAHERGDRAVLIITGKGVQGDGILRRRVPDWLGEPPSRGRVAGYSPAERHHGGDGALYVALKRRGG
ncbi:MAG: hypothetical protein B7Y99_03450 [Caulobacterales bacterium 32-69-10]|nr:MAG: hypothetical protein B7Y99_03450 [Caulobacterales bacterium 32-69-10]